jgi:hypothetical protein
VNDASALNKNLQITTQSESYSEAGTATGQSSKDTLMDYIYYTNLLHMKSPTLLVGVDRAYVHSS